MTAYMYEWECVYAVMVVAVSIGMSSVAGCEELCDLFDRDMMQAGVTQATTTTVL